MANKYDSELLQLLDRGHGHGFFSCSVSTVNHWRYLGSETPGQVQRAMFKGIANAGARSNLHTGQIFAFLCSDDGRVFAERLAKAVEKRPRSGNVRATAQSMLTAIFRKLRAQDRIAKRQLLKAANRRQN